MPLRTSGSLVLNSNSQIISAAHVRLMVFNPISYGTPSLAGMASIIHHSGGCPS